jgi:hypothetical protein
MDSIPVFLPEAGNLSFFDVHVNQALPMAMEASQQKTMKA